MIPYGGPDPEVVAAFREMIRPPSPPGVDADIKCIELDFDAGGFALIVGMRRLIRMPFPARITGAYAYGDVPSSATFQIALGTSADWPVNAPISPASPAYSMGALAFLAFDVTGWNRELQRDDVLDCLLTGVSDSITHLLVALDIRKGPATQRSLGTLTVGDDASNPVVDDSGNPVIDRT